MEQTRLETLAQRDVYANDGTRWRVREARAHGVPGAQASSCLIFDGGSVCRRLWKFPERWKELSDNTLLDIMERRR
jgi:hypothetical protein